MGYKETDHFTRRLRLQSQVPFYGFFRKNGIPSQETIRYQSNSYQCNQEIADIDIILSKTLLFYLQNCNSSSVLNSAS